jgi:N-acetylmuramoyl-L-alanine amidase
MISLRVTILLGSAAFMLAATLAGGPMPSSASLTFAQGGQPPSQQTHAGRSRKARRKLVPAVASPALVRDVRIKAYPDHTRLVLDLQRTTSFTQNRLNNPDRIIIELQNTLLGKTARDRLTDAKLPEEITITQPHPRSVAIALDMTAITDYKLLPLSRPDRLVVDIFNHGSAPPAAPPPAPAAAPQAEAPALAPDPPPVAPIVQAKRPATRGILPPPRLDTASRDVKIIVIDPGHGGKDPGAVGRSGMAEKDITLFVAMRLRDLIVRHLKKGVLMTRDRDVFIELEDRAKFANNMGADLFVSIHVNSHPQRSTKGLEIYHFGEASDRRALEVAARENGTPIKDTAIGWEYLVADLLTTKKVQESLELAWTTKKAMLTRLDDYYDVEDHGVKTAPFYVLRFTTMPSILAEIAFITNPTEERLMQSDTFLYRMADAIFDGIKAYVKPSQTVSR